LAVLTVHIATPRIKQDHSIHFLLGVAHLSADDSGGWLAFGRLFGEAETALHEDRAGKD
jgi:hypothetical protein